MIYPNAPSKEWIQVVQADIGIWIRGATCKISQRYFQRSFIFQQPPVGRVGPTFAWHCVHMANLHGHVWKYVPETLTSSFSRYFGPNIIHRYLVVMNYFSSSSLDKVHYKSILSWSKIFSRKQFRETLEAEKMNFPTAI